MSKLYRDTQQEALLQRMAFIYWTLGALPLDHIQELTDAGISYEWFLSVCQSIQPNQSSTIH